jgi:hypothetical protein
MERDQVSILFHVCMHGEYGNSVLSRFGWIKTCAACQLGKNSSLVIESCCLCFPFLYVYRSLWKEICAWFGPHKSASHVSRPFFVLERNQCSLTSLGYFGCSINPPARSVSPIFDPNHTYISSKHFFSRFFAFPQKYRYFLSKTYNTLKYPN